MKRMTRGRTPRKAYAPARWREVVLFCLGAAMSGAANSAEIYKYISADGTITYSQQAPQRGAFERIEPSCLYTYIGCTLSRSDWSRVPLNRQAYQELIYEAASRHGVDPALLRALIHAESNFDHRALSRAGAQGLMQLMPATQRRFGVRNPYNVGQNVDAGTRLLKELLQRYKNNIKYAAAAYNAGAEAVERYQGIPPYEETQNYVVRVSQLYKRYRQHD